ncbi:cell division protein FtsL [Frigidibacter sp. MR17.24]|uniref:cell division protein FtsL n=1 Tax=Frigidibacter sp. MR17.24 TaxID=3127345 RepID=UPI003012F577
MRSILFVLTALSVMGLAFWAYRENYATQAKITEIDALRSEIAQLTESLGVLKAEWAYLNRPDRLRDLVAINFARLPLLPMQSDQFAAVDQVDYPPEVVVPESLPNAMPARGPVTDPVETSAALAGAKVDAAAGADQE